MAVNSQDSTELNHIPADLEGLTRGWIFSPCHSVGLNTYELLL